MPDMLVDLRPRSADLTYRARADEAGMTIRAALPSDLAALYRFIAEHFEKWKRHTKPIAEREPLPIFLAVLGNEIVGFAIFDSSYLGYFGPIGVRTDLRDHGVGGALLRASLDAMKGLGYAYAVIGDVWPEEFYERACGAQVIAGS